MAKYNQIIDVATGRIVKNFFSNQPAETPTFIYGDVVGMSVTLVETNTGSDNAERPWRLMNMEGKTIRVALGDSDRAPSAGEWQVLSSPLINHDATAAEVETALNADATIAGEGGVTVTGEEGSVVYSVLYNTTGTKTALTSGVNTLIPTSDFYAVTLREGDGTTQKVVSIRLETSASAYVDMVDDIAAPQVITTTVREGGAGVGEVQRVYTTSQAVAGTYALTIDGVGAGEIAFDADVSDIAEAIAVHPTIGGDTSLLSVVGSAADFTVTFNQSLGNIGAISADDSNLTGLNGKMGNLSLNTVEMAQLLGSSASVGALYEIELVDTSEGRGETIHQTSVTVKQDIIPSTPPSVTDQPQYAPLVHTHPISQVDGLQDELDDLQGQIDDVDEAITPKIWSGQATFEGSPWELDLSIADLLGVNDSGVAKIVVYGKVAASQNVKGTYEVTAFWDLAGGGLMTNLETGVMDMMQSYDTFTITTTNEAGLLRISVDNITAGTNTYYASVVYGRRATANQ